MTHDRMHDGHAAAEAPSDLALLRLLQLADSALPIGALSHSFGFEGLIDMANPSVDTVAGVLRAHLEESLSMEAVFCRAGYRDADDAVALRRWNDVLSARKPARESREGSLVLGRRFAALVNECARRELATPLSQEGHLAVLFGAACRLLAIPEESCILAFLEQSCASVLSGLVRLMPLGQVSASVILWELKDWIRQTCRASRSLDPRRMPCFNPSLEIASMRHPQLETRLFVS